MVLAGLGAGGAERVVAQLAARWAEAGDQVTVVAFDRAADPIYHPLPQQVRIERLGIGAGIGGVARRVAALRRVLRRDPPDVLVSFLTKINAVALLATIGSGVPVVAAERNNPERQGASGWWNLALRRLYGRAAAIVCQTHASVRCIPRPWQGRAVVIPNPVRRYPVEPASPAPPVVTAVGRLTRQKGFDLLIEAFAAVAPTHQDWTLHIWGEGPERAALEQQAAELGLAERVRFRGVSTEPGGWIAEAGLFVLSSRYEGFPNVLGEAMAAGLPVLATRCDFGPEELVSDGDNGVLVDPDAAALAAGLRRLLGDPDLRERLAHAARSVEQRFAPPEVLARWDALIEQVANRSPVVAQRGQAEASRAAPAPPPLHRPARG